MRFLTPRRAAIGVAVLALAALPVWIGNPYYVNVSSQILLYAVLALALNVMVGYGGLVSVGQQAYVGLGAYLLFGLAMLAAFSD